MLKNQIRTDLRLHHLFSRLACLGIRTRSWLCWFSDPPSDVPSLSSVPFISPTAVSADSSKRSCHSLTSLKEMNGSWKCLFRPPYKASSSFLSVSKTFAFKKVPQFPVSSAYSHQSHYALCFSLTKERDGAHKSLFHSHWNVMCNVLKGWCGLLLVQRYFLFSACRNVLPFALCSSHSLDHIKA